MNREQLKEEIFRKNSYLCIGLDTEVSKLPVHLKAHPDGIFEFNRQIIDATKEHCVGYKINTAFYEALGSTGWEILERTAAYIPSTHFKIADAKRGDIGNSSAQYAKAFFETLSFDAITVAPYMGEDSVRPFLGYDGKWAIVLGLTSNPGAGDFELQKIVHRTETLIEGMHVTHSEDEFLYSKVLRTASLWGNPQNLMFVMGATITGEFENARKITPDHFYLVPGIGAQGGSLKEISEKALTDECGLLVNVSRAIIYASEKENFAEKAELVARQYRNEMKSYLESYLKYKNKAV